MDNFCGKRLDGRYEIREIIGVGGMAVVYKAYDNIDDRIVAIKILKEEYLSNEEFKRRFKNESKAIAVLSHPNIVRVYNVSFGDRLQYIVMEYVDGITLKEYIEQQGIINWKEAVHFVGQILAALQHAHDKGIVHQDIKPQNIMLLQDGTIKVTDFGIARFSRSDVNTISDKAIGSVHYISPEQARGEMTDEKADIYSVGVVLYEMLTGQLPFQSDSAVSVALMQVQQEPVRPSQITPSIPLGIEQITIRAMQKSRQSRYRSAAEMLLDINEFKRNPSIKFNYSYFVDSEPTKYIRSTSDSVVKESKYNNRDNQQEESSGMSKSSAIMVGAIAGIIVLAAIICVILFGVNSKNKVEVPNFNGMNYYTDIENNSQYENFEFVTEFAEDGNRENGTVIEQVPGEDKKVKVGSKITLTIVNNEELKLIDKSIIGMSKADADEYLISNKLKPQYINEYSETVKPGNVIKTVPEAGTSVKPGTTVKVYIATNVKEEVEVPKVIGCGKDEAEQLLIGSGLTLGTVTEVNSDLDVGVIVTQSVQEGEKVPAGSAIDIEISNGIPSNSSAEIVVKLPAINKPGILKVYINNELSYTSGELYLGGSTQIITVTGSGSNNEYTVTIDDAPVQKGKIDFTKLPAVVSEVEEIVVLINVVGLDKDLAIAKLNAAGFKNIECINSPSNTYPAGTVIAQIPVSDGSSRFSVNESITLTVSTGPSV
ncbi:MAG: Stk1 family PASTA domain-containing Ser/Thr kinase [Clostridia bacterium]|nr:Stk1 family PASTA domain-containing Ser/Thr kinase [Clostridia bacterium]